MTDTKALDEPAAHQQGSNKNIQEQGRALRQASGEKAAVVDHAPRANRTELKPYQKATVETLMHIIGWRITCTAPDGTELVRKRAAKPYTHGVIWHNQNWALLSCHTSAGLAANAAAISITAQVVDLKAKPIFADETKRYIRDLKRAITSQKNWLIKASEARLKIVAQGGEHWFTPEREAEERAWLEKKKVELAEIEAERTKV